MGETEQKVYQVKVGDSVYYWAYGTPGGEYPMTYRAAIVTQVAEPNNPVSNVGLCVLNPTGIFFNTDIPWGFAKSGHWSWITE